MMSSVVIPVVVVAPAEEPVTLAEIRDHLKIVNASQDAYLGGLLVTARSYVENMTGRALISQTIEITGPAFPAARSIVLPRPPLISVAAVTYIDTAGAQQTMASSLYHVETRQRAGAVTLKADAEWPAVADQHPSAVVVRYVAGYANPAAVPVQIKHAIKLLVAHWYYNREATGDTRQAVPMAFDALTAQFATHGWI